MRKPRLWFIKIKDKIIISKGKYCPAHFWPHKLPFTGLVKNEACHLHKKKWRMNHHRFFCKFLKCPHYKKMIEYYKKYKNKNLKTSKN